MSDLVDRLRHDAHQLTKMVEHANLAGPETGVRVKDPSLLLADLSEAADEIERLQRELAEARKFRAILEGHLGAAIDDYKEALKALEPFARVAEHDIGEDEADSEFFVPMLKNHRALLLTVGDLRNALAVTSAKAEETPQ